MIYLSELKKEYGLFERAYKVIEGKNIGRIFIKNTPGGKKRFLKKVSGDILFPCEFLSDDILGGRLTRAVGNPEQLIRPLLGKMIDETMRFADLKPPIYETALFCKDGWEEFLPLLAPLSRLITVVGEERENIFFEGAPVRFAAKIKRLPSLAVIIDENARLAPILRVPTVDLRRRPEAGKFVLTKDAVAFRVPEILKELGCESLDPDTAAYFLEKGYDFSPELLSLRKKSASFFTFS